MSTNRTPRVAVIQIGTLKRAELKAKAELNRALKEQEEARCTIFKNEQEQAYHLGMAELRHHDAETALIAAEEALYDALDKARKLNEPKKEGAQ